jgi:hypothetical protein
VNPYLRAASKHPAVAAQALERLASRLETAKRAPARVTRLRQRAEQLARTALQPPTLVAS